MKWDLHTLPGVERVVPRIVGRTYLGDHLAVVVGISDFADMRLLSGSLPVEKGDTILGEGVAKNLALQMGDPFNFSIYPIKPFQVSGLLNGKLDIWSSNLILISFEDAAELFKLLGKATELLVYSRPGTAKGLAFRLTNLIQPWNAEAGLRIQTKDIASQYVDKGFSIQAGTPLISWK